MRSLQAALDEFLRAPATHGYSTNEGVVLAVMGTKGDKLKDCPTFDAVRLKYEKPNACTFEQAFKACWGGKRDWRDFDFATLRDSHEEFSALELPLRVQEALEREAIAEEHQRIAGDDEPSEEFPPLELLRRRPPDKKRRKPRRSPKKVSAATRRYLEAKRAYHSTGEQLHWMKIAGTMV